MKEGAVLFIDLPLGTRFRFTPENPHVFIVIDRTGVGKVAKWEGPNQRPAMQQIFVAADSPGHLPALMVWIDDPKPLDEVDRNIVIGALDTMAIELTQQKHTWDNGQRAIYEEALKIMQAHPIE